MDDILMAHEDKELLRKVTRHIADMLNKAGWALNEEKCVLEPAVELIFLGPSGLKQE